MTKSLIGPDGRGKKMSICFTITGEFMTQHARDLVYEGNFNGAMRFLTESLVGFDDGNAVMLLNGSHRLTGDSSTAVLFEPDPDGQEYIDRIQENYEGLLRHGSKHYRPYAWIDDYGVEDVQLAGSRGYRDPGEDAGFEDRFPSTGAMSTSMHNARVRVYMDDPFSDIHYKLQLPLDGKHSDLNAREILFRRVDVEVPFFIPVRTEPQEVVYEAVKRGHMRKTGHAILFPPIEVEDEQTSAALWARVAAKANAGPTGRATGMEAVIGGAMANMLSVGMDPMRVQELAGTLHKKHVMNEGVSTEFVTREEALPNDHGYLAPNGSFIPCLVMEHVELCMKLMGSEELVEKARWRKLASGKWEQPLVLADGCKDKNQVTQEQLRFIRLWYEHRDRLEDFKTQEFWVLGGGDDDEHI